VDPQTAEDAVRVEPQQTWTDAIRATLTPRDHAVADEVICELLDAPANGEPLAQRLASRNISLPTYCVWKAKYRQMSLEQLRTARRRERWRARGLFAGLLVVAVVGGSGIVFGVARAVQSQVAGATGAVRAGSDASSSTSPVSAANQPLAAADPAGRADVPFTDSTPSPNDHGDSSARTVATAAATAAAKVTSREGQSIGDAPFATGESGYKIQVAAANTEEEGRAIVGRLAEAGYRSYMLGVAVNNAEVFRVRVGPFDTLESAQAIAGKLRQDGYREAWITR
jgi:cell division septation protein DedD